MDFSLIRRLVRKGKLTFSAAQRRAAQFPPYCCLCCFQNLQIIAQLAFPTAINGFWVLLWESDGKREQCHFIYMAFLGAKKCHCPEIPVDCKWKLAALNGRTHKGWEEGEQPSRISRIAWERKKKDTGLLFPKRGTVGCAHEFSEGGERF